MNHAILAVLLCIGFASSGASGDDRLSDSKLQNIPWRIRSIVRGGTWTRSDAFGHCRLVVAEVEWAEYTTYQVFIQWLRVDHQQYRFIVEHTTRVSELDGYHILEAPRRLASGPIKPDESFEVTAIPETTDTDEYFTITPRPDYTYSLTRSSVLRNDSPLAPFVTGAIGLVIGILVAYAKLRSRNA